MNMMNIWVTLLRIHRCSISADGDMKTREYRNPWCRLAPGGTILQSQSSSSIRPGKNHRSKASLGFQRCYFLDHHLCIIGDEGKMKEYRTRNDIRELPWNPSRRKCVSDEDSLIWISYELFKGYTTWVGKVLNIQVIFPSI